MEIQRDIDLLAEIYNKQEVLNGRILASLGISYDEVMCNAQGECPNLAPTWVENYRKAISSEMVEFLASDKYTKNAKIELVDVLHFLVSLSQIVGVPPYMALNCINDPDIFKGVELSRAVLVTLDNLQNACEWKWWATGGSFALDEAQMAVEDLWSIFGIMMGVVGMSWHHVYDIYMKKNAVNHKRQDEGYDLRTKTEADNESIDISPPEPVSQDGESPSHMMMAPVTEMSAYWPTAYEPEDD
jgi:dimeric dUTPase (all-alpha-NTP-PPase superfamily)